MRIQKIDDAPMDVTHLMQSFHSHHHFGEIILGIRFREASDMVKEVFEVTTWYLMGHELNERKIIW